MLEKEPAVRHLAPFDLAVKVSVNLKTRFD